MVSIRPYAAFLALSSIVVASLAQPAPNAPATAASATPRGPMARFGSDYTPGWSMMTPAEREQHRQQMHAATTAAECQRVRDEHRKLMTERARARGMANMPSPRRDACANLPR